MASIKLCGVEKNFSRCRVIKKLDLSIGDGEFFTFVGPSGCGKSTLLNMISGLEETSGGDIFFDRKRVNDLSPRERDVAMVFQSYALYPHMSVFDNIAFPLKMKKTAPEAVRSEVSETAELLGLGGLLSRKPRELSGGERQRVALARAIVRRPCVFLLDEPLSNLDARLRVQMRAELKKLHRRLGITMIYVTHDQEEAMSLSDRIAVFYGGEIQQCGTPEEVYRRARNTFVAGFIGSPPMNFVPARVTAKNPLRLDINGMPLETPLREAPAGEKALLGIRPEDIAVKKSAAGQQEAIVEVLEYSGAGYWADLNWQGVRLKGFVASGERPCPGEAVSFDLPPEKCHLFCAASGQRLN